VSTLGIYLIWVGFCFGVCCGPTSSKPSRNSERMVQMYQTVAVQV